jgi:hypothetical protein
MTLAKIGTGIGFGMMALGAIGRVAHVGSPKRDPMGSRLDEVSGSLIVFGFVIGMVSTVADCRSELVRREQ